MATNVNMGSTNPVQGATDVIHFSNVDGLKETLDNIDIMNIRTSFKAAKDPIYLAFDHIDKQPLKKVAKDFVRDISDGLVEFISAIPAKFLGA